MRRIIIKQGVRIGEIHNEVPIPRTGHMVKINQVKFVVQSILYDLDELEIHIYVS